MQGGTLQPGAFLMDRAFRMIAVLAAPLLFSACDGPPAPGYPRLDGGLIYAQLRCRVVFIDPPRYPGQTYRDPYLYRYVYCPHLERYRSRPRGWPHLMVRRGRPSPD
jgi:hypothetical protein